MSTERTFNIVRAASPSMMPVRASQTAIDLAPESFTSRHSVLLTLWRRRWVVLLAFVTCAIAGGAYLTKATPIYTSSSRLLVEQSGPEVIATGGGIVTKSRNYLHTQCELLRSTPILSEAVKLLGSRKLLTFGEATDRVALLKTSVKASVGNADDIITVTLDSPYRQEAAEIVNAIVESYIAYQSRQQRNTAGEILKILQREKVRRDAELKDRFEAVMAFKRSNEIISFGTDKGNIIIQRLDTLSDSLTQAELALMDAKAKYETTRTLLADPRRMRQLQYKLLAGQGTGPPETNALEEERNRLNLELAGLRLECTEDHPKIQALKSQLKHLDEQDLKNQQALVGAHLGWLEQQVLAAAGRVDELKKSFEAQRKLAQELNSKAAEFAMLEAEQKRGERICDILDNRIKEINTTEDAGALNISLLETARAAVAPSKPKKAQVMSIALALGLLLGIGLVFVGEWVDHRLRSVEEVTEALGLPVLGVIPRLSHRKGLGHVARVAQYEPSSHAAEAYRTVRTAVYFGTPDIQTKTLTITSPAPKDGKSTLVSNLGVAMAHAGQKVLILDADFRKPCQHKLFDIDPDTIGVTEVLCGVDSLDKAIRRTEIDGLDLLPCGKIPPNPSEILNSEAFGKLLAELSGRYDRILVDAPPVLSLADARILGARCDAALLVLRAEKSSRKPSQQAVESLLNVGTRILGVVVNRVANSRQKYGYYDYGYYYHYGSHRKELEATTDDREARSDANHVNVA